MINYNFSQKTLHRVILSSNLIKKGMYEFEKIFFLKKNLIEDFNKHVFISGLPRSGTTFLLEQIYNSGDFGSLTYNDMPYVMSPNIFSKLNYKVNFKKKERFHKDGIFINLESPEALDEIFFSTFNIDKINEEIVNYIFLILKKKNKKRYLSKNNLNYKRFETIKKKLFNSIFLIPFRNPIQQSSSLLNQHINFLKIQNKNKFILEYMNFLNHREFGKNHLSWNKPIRFDNFLDLNYWLEQWYLFYKNILYNFKNQKNLFFVCYEDLESKRYVNNLFDLIDINQGLNFQNKVKKINNFNIDKLLFKDTNEVYSELRKSSELK